MVGELKAQLSFVMVQSFDLLMFGVGTCEMIVNDRPLHPMMAHMPARFACKGQN